MRVLFVSRSNSKGQPHAFVSEQADAISKLPDGIEVNHFLIRKGGIGYFMALYPLIKELLSKNYDVVHAHYGLSAITAILASKLLLFSSKKTVITFHGSDLNVPRERRISLLMASMADINILVSSKMTEFGISNSEIIPCGIDFVNLQKNREELRTKSGWGEKDVVILFSSSFDRDVKDPSFAFRVVELVRAKLTHSRLVFLELKGYSRSELNNLMVASDMLLMCSKTEGSPQVIKEALMNGLPIISNDVGEVSHICSHSSNVHIVRKTEEDFCAAIESLLNEYGRSVTDPTWLSQYDNVKIAQRIRTLYAH